ncbi:MAG: zeta toxin family protein [Burkholderiales bacterium]|nr:zeta toxin family protein [Burkholderiales bacterium]
MAHPAHVPRIFVLAGTNGAGKSSIGGATIRRRGGHYFNPDEAAAAIRRAQPHLSATQANSAAWHEGKRLLQQAIAQKLDYNFETTLGGSSFTRLLESAAQQGFEVRIWYVGLSSPEQHIARVKARVLTGGHDIPEVDIRRRFDQSRLQLIQLLPHLAELRVYDNSTEADPHAGLAPQPCLVLHWQAAQATDQQPARVLTPVGAEALATTPEWAKPLVVAAFKAGIKSGGAPKVKGSTTAARPARNRPAK